MYFHDPAKRATKEVWPGVSIRSFLGEEILLGVVDLDPNTVVPPHRHPHEQAGIVLGWEMELCVGGEVRLLRPGEVYVIPGDVEHSARTMGAGARVVDIFSPAREDWKY